MRDRQRRLTASCSSWFETGLLHSDEWTARWIGWEPEATPPVDPPGDWDLATTGLLGHLNRRLPSCTYLVKSFVVEAPILRARLYISAHGLYQAFINGHRIGDGELTPGWTNYRSRVQYQVYDVTAEVVQGDNVVAAVLGDGWYCGRVGPGGRRLGEHYGSRHELIAQLRVDHVSGAATTIVSDNEWVASRSGPLRFSDLLAGEYFDATRLLGGWAQANYDHSGWTPVAVSDIGHETLVATGDEPVRATEFLRPVRITQVAPGRFIADLGQNMVGRVRLTVHGANAGDRVVLRHAEMLDQDGCLYTENLRTAAATDIYVAAGHPVEIYEPQFTFHGFRFVEVAGYPQELRPEDLVGVVMHSDTPRTGEVTTSDDLVNQLLSNIWWGQRGNFVSVPTDCPQRDERLGWLADAQVFFPTASFNADVAAFFRRWMRDVVDDRLPSGAFPDVAPRVVFEREGAPGWGDAGVIIPWQLFQIYRDRETLSYCFPAMVGWIEHIWRHNPSLIWVNRVGNHYGDWLQVDVETPRDVIATAYFAHSTYLVARAAEALGRREEADRFTMLADNIRARYIEEFVATDGAVLGDTQTGYLLSLAFGLLPDALVSAAVDRLASNIASRGNRLSTGFLGVALLCPVLTDHGRADLAYALLHQTEYPSWGYAIRRGATTIWERWDGWTEASGFQSPAMNSFNHYALGSIGEWLFRCVAGIDQDTESAGYRRVLIRPVPGGKVTWAKAWFESEQGRIESAWQLRGELLGLTVRIPPGAMARICVPTSAPDAVLESGRPVTEAEDLTVCESPPGMFVCEVSSGVFSFQAPR